ncbi:hypothetical protein BDK51DRAFT_41194 [Blyttiomyces helicus]|uniref:Uncharacterized protein n=1 Tax=Blyttiomyces helicus TaxID=388810 RepID=A0A4P9WFT3_9FUNG|nr:hypothetical protein BDK51DRAFT_41194 [Blyttiomyces helicus]|eukprot:RKO90188.1 hypothetical protein BDK51DRAFT_41194 [Blyttiomyces helicus]
MADELSEPFSELSLRSDETSHPTPVPSPPPTATLGPPRRPCPRLPAELLRVIFRSRAGTDIGDKHDDKAFYGMAKRKELLRFSLISRACAFAVEAVELCILDVPWAALALVSAVLLQSPNLVALRVRPSGSPQRFPGVEKAADLAAITRNIASLQYIHLGNTVPGEQLGALLETNLGPLIQAPLPRDTCTFELVRLCFRSLSTKPTVLAEPYRERHVRRCYPFSRDPSALIASLPLLDPDVKISYAELDITSGILESSA